MDGARQQCINPCNGLSRRPGTSRTSGSVKASVTFGVRAHPIIMAEKIMKTDEEWREQLTPEQYRITRKAGTEPAFTGKYWKSKDKGVYVCVGCGEELFKSDSSSIQAPAGQVFGSPSIREKLRNTPTAATEWSARRRVAPVAEPTLGMCLKTVQRRPGFATA